MSEPVLNPSPEALRRALAKDLASAEQAPSQRQQLLRTYKFYAPLYDLVFGAMLEQGRRRLAERVRELAPASVLEVGVGTGLTLFRYPREAKIVGVDISAEMLARARTKANSLADRNISLLTMDAENSVFPDGSFDCVTLPYVLSVTPDPKRLIRELKRVCVQGGRILVLNHFSGSRFWALLERAVHPIADRIGFHSEFRFEDHARDWNIESVQSVNPFGLSKLVEIRND